MKRILQALCLAGSFTAAAVASAPAAAQAYPTKPVRIIVGFAAGGPTDVIARVLAQDLSELLGQGVVVENRTGANALIATEAVAKAPADGYMLLFNSLNHNVNPLLLETVNYHPLRDFAPISLVAQLPQLVVTHPDSGFDSVQSIIQRAKEKPDTVTYGSAGNGGSAHLAGALLETTAGVKMVHVPFRGNAPALTEVLAGRISFMFYPMIGIADHVKQNRLKVLAVGTAERHPDYPNVPTMSEAGFQGFQDTAPWVGLLAPAGTPDAVVNRLNEAVRASLAKPETRKRLQDLGGIPVGDKPQEFRAFLEKDSSRWERVIKTAGIKGQ
jgi:tripartite-type tricarboxylate transporter receptor subunit TctC